MDIHSVVRFNLIMNFPRLKLGVTATALLFAAAVARPEPGAFVPSNPPEMKPLAGQHSPAHKTAALFQRGANLGNYLEIPKGQFWGVRITTNDFDRIKAEGFDHIRVPVGWQYYAGPGPDYKLEDDIFRRVDFVVTNTLARGLAVMINVHHFDAFTTDPAGRTDELIALWRQIAAHYAAAPDNLVFELLNEPHDAATTEIVCPIYAKLIAEIRQTNPKRTLVVSPGNWGGIKELKDLVLPAEDDNLLVTVHCYEPYRFTHQGANWGGPEVRGLRGIKFPGPPETPLVLDTNLSPAVQHWISNYNTLPTEKNPSSRAAFEPLLKMTRQWSDYYGRPVYVGEFGAYTRADPQSRANYYREFREALAEQKLGWAIWDWNSGFHYWDSRRDEPAPGMREALFGKE